MNLRFLQRMGAPPAEAVAAGAVDDASETIVQVALLLRHAPVRRTSTSTRASSVERGPDRRLLIGDRASRSLAERRRRPGRAEAARQGRAAACAGRSRASGAWPEIRRKRLELFGGNVASELLYALALGATCLAYGVDLNLAQLVFINTAASVLSSLIPVPGRDRRRRGEPLGRPHRDGGRRVDGLRDRDHAAPLHVLPPADLGLLLTALARDRRATSSAGS